MCSDTMAAPCIIDGGALTIPNLFRPLLLRTLPFAAVRTFLLLGCSRFSCAVCRITCMHASAISRRLSPVTHNRTSFTIILTHPPLHPTLPHSTLSPLVVPSDVVSPTPTTPTTPTPPTSPTPSNSPTPIMEIPSSCEGSVPTFRYAASTGLVGKGRLCK